MKNKIIRTLIGVAIGVIFMYLTLNNKPLVEIFESLKSARISWILMSILGLIASFYLRAFRWKALLESADTKPNSYNVIHSLILGYFVNSFTPKFGEIVRCTNLKKTDKIPNSVSLGTVVSERIYDVLVLFLGLAVIFMFELDRLGSILIILTNNLISIISRNILNGVLAFTFLVLLLYALYWFSKRNKFAERVKNFLSKMVLSLKSSLKMKKYKIFILLTIFIWLSLIFVYYSFLMSLPETNSFGLYFSVVVLFIGSVGWAIPSPGGIGTSNFMILQLFVAFNLNEQSGVSFGLLASGITFGVTVGLGSLALIYNVLRQRRIALVHSKI
jgi:glycosyltransferase 2 family protein